MHATLPLLVNSGFPPISRKKLEILQINLGYKCNQSCTHCHVNAGPKRTEEMSYETIGQALELVDGHNIAIVDITGGAPEMNPHFRDFVRQLTARGVQVMDRCNLTILDEPGYEDMAGFLAGQGVEVIASLPCYLGDNVDRQRGKGAFASSIRVISRLNQLGYGMPGSALTLNLIFNPQEAILPPPQDSLEKQYKQELNRHYGISFNRLLAMTNVPIGRFGSVLVSKGMFDEYMHTLKTAYRETNLDTVMCRNLISVDWQGNVFDCDFNQMLKLPMRFNGHHQVHLSDLLDEDLDGNPITVRGHCFACTAGRGSSCGGALD